MDSTTMKKIHADKVWDSVIGKTVDETFFGSKIIERSVSEMVSIVLTQTIPTQKCETVASTLVKSLDETGELESICYAVLEFILNGLTMRGDIKGGEAKYRNVRLNTSNKIRNSLLMLEDNIENSMVAVQFVEMGLQSMSKYIETLVINDGKTHLKYRLRPEYHDEIIDDVRGKAENGFYALPMTEPPLDWEVQIDAGRAIVVGGYRGLSTNIIRGSKIDMPKSSFSPNFLAHSTEPLKALNIIQSVPFRINKANLERIKGNMMDDPIKPSPSETVKTSKQNRFEFFTEYPTKESREEAGVVIPEIPVEVLEYDASVSQYKTLKGKLVSARMAVKIAEMFQHEEAIYFPHSFDYRGRIYPSSSSLTPQGDDIAKGLLEFANPVELTDEGVEACYAYFASVYGYDKEPYKKRVKLGHELMVADVDFNDAEEPYVFCQMFDLLHQIETTGSLESRVAIAIDGSCNGLQHMAAITMDKAGGAYVNVGPAQDRQDIYIEIANHSATLMLEDLTAGNYDDDDQRDQLELLHGIMTGDKARKIAKRPVMINPYGGTFMGYKEYILQALQEFYPAHSTNMNAAQLTQYINRAMSQKLNGGTKYQQWVRETFSSVARAGILPQFRTPDGFLVRNYSYEVETTVKHMKSIVSRSGQTTIRLQNKTTDINSRKIGTRAQPNIIHALDANHLRMTAIAASEQGVGNLWFIHDSFASDPNNFALLNRLTRETFIELYSGDRHPTNTIINKLQEQIDDNGVDYSIRPFPEFQGEERLQLNKVVENEFFFA